jgi:uncharacterized membrane protein HdeD (DUF308 family)
MQIAVAREWRHWWVFLIRGILFIGVGIYMIASPATGFAAMGFTLGLILFVTGVAELLRVVRERTEANRAWHLMLGIIDIILGLALMGHITVSEVIIRVVVGLWFLFRGISMVWFSGLGQRVWVLTLGGAVIILVGLAILFNAAFGAATIVILTAIAFIIMGIMNISLSMRMKGR